MSTSRRGAGTAPDPPHRWVEDAYSEHPLQYHEQQGNADDRGREDLDPRCRIGGPDEKRHLEPSHPRCSHPVNRRDEVEAREDRRESQDKRGQERRDHVRRCPDAVRDVECPPGIRRPSRQKHRRQGNDAACNVEIPRKEVQPREKHVLCTDHDRDHKIPKHRRPDRDHKKENHNDAVKRKERIVGLRLNDGSFRLPHFDTHEEAKRHCSKEEQEDSPKIQDADALVIHCQEPAEDSLMLRTGMVKIRFS